jgi:hypothetical protein
LTVALGFVARVAAWGFKGGFHYPDEIFQQVEPAQYLRTGVAWLPWEFVRGLRSWFLPGIYAGCLEVLSWLGVTGLPAFRLLGLQNAVLSVVMIPAGYRIGAALWPQDDCGREKAAVSVAAFTALLPALVYYTPHTLIGTPCMVALTWGYVYWLEARRSDAPDARSLLLCGLFFGIAGALRLTCGLHMLVPLADLLLRYRAHALKPLLAGAALPVAIDGLLDLFTWGVPFHSTIEHLRYNLFERGARHHGTSPWYFYAVESLWRRSGPLAGLTILVALSAWRRTWIVWLTLLLPTVLLSLEPHKEERFLMYDWPLIAATLGIGWWTVAGWLNQRVRPLGGMVAAALLVAILASNLRGTSELRWTERRGMFQAQAFVGAQDDATGLLFHERPHMNGGYLVFQKTVPQVPFRRGLLVNPLYNYAALLGKGGDAFRLRRMGWHEVTRFDDIVVLKRRR